MPSAGSGHGRLDARSLALHRAIAAKLRENPELLEIARENLTRWIRQGGRSTPYWEAWQEILSKPLPEIMALIQEDSQWMTALRQSTPFAGILTPKERWKIYDAFAIGTYSSSGGGDR